MGKTVYSHRIEKAVIKIERRHINTLFSDNIGENKKYGIRM
jgi:hypothetical protein